MRFTLRGATFFFVSSLIAAPVFGEDWKPARLWVVGGEQSVWVVGAADAKGSALPVVQMWRSGKDGDAASPKQSIHLPPISGDPQFVGADAESLHILFSNLTECDYFGDRAYSPGPVWQEQCRSRPLAWAGDATTTAFWAIVETDALTVTPVASAPSDKDSTSMPADDRPESRRTLLQLQNGAWRRRAMPEEADGARTFWLASREGKPAILWADGEKVVFSQLDDDKWSGPKPTIIKHDFHHAWIGAATDGIVFAVARASGDKLVKLELYQHKNGTWIDLGAARKDNEFLLVDPELSAVGVARGQLVVARSTPAHEVEFGIGPLSTSPALRFSTLRIRHEESGQRPVWEDAVTTALAMAIMFVTLLTRRATATNLVPLPQGLALAAIWKRLLAAIVDFMPALILTSPWWSPKVLAISEDLQNAISPDQRPFDDIQLHFEVIAMIVCYGIWCFVWEAMMGRTPGKMIMGIRVISIEGSRPTGRQCLIRNAARVLMMNLAPAGLLVTIMTMAIMTKNRQRLGDLLAHTLVVGPGNPTRLVPVQRNDDQQSPFD